MVFRRKPRNAPKPKAKPAPKQPASEAPRMINGVRVAKASTIVRQGS